MSSRFTANIVYRSNIHSKLFARYTSTPLGHLLFSTTKLQKPALNSDALSHPMANHNKSVGLWLLTCSGLVFGMVVVGGLTRMTKSGLSMTDWKFQGGLPPLTQSEWQAEFLKYQQFPEFQRVNQHISLTAFKRIYRWEYAHRMYGRLLGCAFTLPLLYYALRRRLNPALYSRLGLLLALGGGQGLVGWWMVRSGLHAEGNATHNDLPRVSPYRLATHLGFAFVLYALLMYNGLSVFSQRAAAQHLLRQSGCAAEARMGGADQLQMYRVAVRGMATLALSTALMGGFVAGNEAGLVYNEWPRMGLGLVPSDLVNPYIESPWRNLFENSTTVQFAHRNLAYATVLGSVALLAYTRRLSVAGRVGGHVVVAAGALMGVTLMQATLGVVTLVHYVPIALASLHQAGSMTVLGMSVWLMFLSRRRGYCASRKLMDQVRRSGKPAFLQSMCI